MVLDTNAVRRVNGDTSVAAHRNVGDQERWASVVGGAVLAVYGLDRRDLGGGLLAVLGAELIRRGATGHCLLYDALNVSTASDATARGPHRDLPASRAATVRASRAVKVEHSVTVKRPAAELYAFWRDPANLPRVIEFVESAEQLSGRTAGWRARGPAGKVIEWDAEIINDIPNELLAWKSVGDADVPNAGSLHFREAPNGRGTEVRIVFEYEPPAGHIGAWIAKLVKEDPSVQLRDALRRFKQLAETGEILTTEGQTSGR
ncbi:MAG: SRPBCC family protein [Gemmatimonadaceae bacterium]